MMQAFDSQMPPSPWVLEEDLTRGVLWRRVVGWFLDLAILGLLTMALWIVLVTFGMLTLGLGFPLLSLLPVVPLIYQVGFLAGPGAATPGQAAVGLVVVRDADLGRPDVLQAVVFTLLFYLTMAVGFVLLVVALFTMRKRALHDLGAGLRVVRRRALTEAAQHWNMPGYA